MSTLRAFGFGAFCLAALLTVTITAVDAAPGQMADMAGPLTTGH